MFIKPLQVLYKPDEGANFGYGEYSISAEQLGDVRLDDSQPDTPDVSDNSDEVLTDENEQDSEEIDQEYDLLDEDDTEDDLTDEQDELDDDTEYEITVDGEKIKVGIQEALNGYMRQSKFTKEMQGLAQQRQAFETEITQQKEQLQEQFQPYIEFEQMLQNNPKLAEQVAQAIQENQATQQQIYDPRVQELQSQIQQLQSQLQGFNQVEQERQIQTEWTEFLTKYPDAKDRAQELAEFADKKGYNLEDAWKLLNYDTVKTTTAKKVVENQMKSSKKSASMKQANSKGRNEKTDIPKGYNDLEKFLSQQNLNLFD